MPRESSVEAHVVGLLPDELEHDAKVVLRRARRRDRIASDPGVRERENAYALEQRRLMMADPVRAEKHRAYEREYRRRRAAANPGLKAEQHRQWRGKYPTEAKVERYLVTRVEALSGMCPKFNDPGRRGAPDRIVCLPGHRAYFVELKRPKIGVLDEHQERYHADLRKAGQLVWVLWSVDDVDDFFTAIHAT